MILAKVTVEVRRSSYTAFLYDRSGREIARWERETSHGMAELALLYQDEAPCPSCVGWRASCSLCMGFGAARRVREFRLDFDRSNRLGYREFAFVEVPE